MPNIEPLAREVSAAEIEVGNVDDAGNRLPGSDWRKRLEAYRERLARK